MLNSLLFTGVVLLFKNYNFNAIKICNLLFEDFRLKINCFMYTH